MTTIIVMLMLAAVILVPMYIQRRRRTADMRALEAAEEQDVAMMHGLGQY